MINIQFSIHNPWAKEFRFHNYKCYSWKFGKNKALEVELLGSSDIIDIHLSMTRRQSHAGIKFELGLLGYNLHCMFYDTRHWDYVLNKWEIYEDTNSKTNH